jgi:hypothetical protein
MRQIYNQTEKNKKNTKYNFRNNLILKDVIEKKNKKIQLLRNKIKNKNKKNYKTQNLILINNICEYNYHII